MSGVAVPVFGGSGVSAMCRCAGVQVLMGVGARVPLCGSDMELHNFCAVRLRAPLSMRLVGCW